LGADRKIRPAAKGSREGALPAVMKWVDGIAGSGAPPPLSGDECSLRAETEIKAGAKIVAVA
jgi:hypothetical protein